MATTQQLPARPFVQASHEHTELAQTRSVTALTTSLQQQDGLDIPAVGFLRGPLLEVTGSGGVIGPGVVQADFPWCVLQNIQLQDVNGTNICAPIDGFALYVINLFGGYVANSNPASAPGFSANALTFKFHLRIPVEIIHENALGTLANESTATQYKLGFAFSTIAQAYSTAPTTAPAVQVKVWTEAWTQPPPTDAAGIPNQQVPPLLGTSQFITPRTYPVGVGQNTVQLSRVGNQLRNLFIIARNASGVRDDTVMFDPVTLNWDTNQLQQFSQYVFNALLNEKYVGASVNSVGAFAAFPRPNGVFVMPFTHAGELQALGTDNMGALYLPTTLATRLEWTGNIATAGTLQIITNDVAPVETNIAERFAVPNATSFQAQRTN